MASASSPAGMVNTGYAQQQQHMQAFPQQQQQQQQLSQAGPSSAPFPGMQPMNGASPAAGNPAELQQNHAALNSALPPNFSREQLTQMSMRMAQLRQQGFTEQTSHELSSIAHTFNAIQRQMAKMKQLQLQHQQHASQPQLQPQPPQPGMPGFQDVSHQRQGAPHPAMNGMQQPSSASLQQQPPMHQAQMPMSQSQQQPGPPNGMANQSGPSMNGAMQNGQRDGRPLTGNQGPSQSADDTNGTLQQAGQGGADNNAPQHAVLTPQQMAAFKAQVFALRFLQNGRSIPAPVAAVIFSNGSQTAPSPSAGPDSAASPGVAGPSSAKLLRASPEKIESPAATFQPLNAPLVPTPDIPREQQQPQVPAPQPLQVQDMEPELEIEEVPDTIIAPYNAYKNPRAVLAALRLAAQQHQQDGNRTAPTPPSLLPYGLDAYTLQQERNRFIEARIGQRRKELENLPSLLGDGSEHVDVDALEQLPDADKKQLLASQKLKAIIELKSLNLLQRQRQLREDVVRGLNQAVSLNLVADRTAYRAQRKITLKDARIVDQLERQQKIDRENRAKQKHLDQLLAIAKHGRSLEEAHQAHRQRHIRLGRNIMRWHIEAEKEEQKRVERISKERLKALRNNDEEAYLKLIDTAKDTRITHLLRQTDSFLDSLAQAVVAQQESASDKDPMAVDQQRDDDMDLKEEEGEAQFGAAPVFQEEAAESNKVDYYGVAHRIKETVSKQPTILTGGTLKEYQIKGLQWMISLYNNRLNGILADEMGLGKTIQTISLITYLIETKKQAGPYLCIVPLSTLPNWMLEFEKWAPSVRVVTYKGSPPVRKAMQNQMKMQPFQVCLTTYEYIIKDRPFLCRYKWVHMIIDEGHRMKNSNSKLSQTLTQYYSSRYRLILTGTPLQNNLPELWALLNFVLPKVFNSQKSFDEWFNTPFAGTGSQDKIDLNEEEALLIIRRLHKVLRPFLLRRLKKDVESELPDKVERLIRCKMSALQLKLYKQMKENGMLITHADGGKSSGSNKAGMKGLQNTIMQLRKICNHPFVFQQVEDLLNPYHVTNDLLFRVAGKFELLDRILPKLFATGHRVLMFFQMTEIMNIMEDYLRYRSTTFLRLDGSTKPDERGEMLAQFNHPQSKIPIFLLSTRAGGLGLNLQVADTVIIYDSDWNPHQDLQAQDRAHRIGQKKEVRIFRLVTEKSVEEQILERARQKLEIDKKVIQGGRFDNKSSASEREEFLRGLLEANEDEEDDSADLGDDELNELLSRSEEEVEIFTQMDVQRRQQEEQEWIRQGNQGPLRERLITDAELPEVYHMEHDFAPIVDEILDQPRKKNVIHYDDGLTEEQWTQAIEDNVDLKDVIDKNRKTRFSNSYSMLDDDGFSTSDPRTRGNSTNGDFDESEAGSPGPSGPSKKRKRLGLNGSRAASIDTASTSGDIGGKAPLAAKRRKTGKAAAVDDPDLQKLKQTMESIFETIEDVDNEEEGHQCCGLFYKLPSKKDYPEYYIMIPRPICMNEIKKKIDKYQYNTLDDFIADFKLMFNNAKIFNDDASIVYKDTLTMEKAFDAKVAEVTGQNGFLAPPQPSAMQTQLPSQAPYGYQQQQTYPMQLYQPPSRVNAIINSDDDEDDDDEDD